MNVTKCSSTAKFLDPTGHEVKASVPVNQRKVYLAASISLGIATLGIPHGVYAWKKKHKFSAAAPTDLAVAHDKPEPQAVSLAKTFVSQADDIRQLLQQGVFEDLLQDHQNKSELEETTSFCLTMRFIYNIDQAAKTLALKDRTSVSDLNFTGEDLQKLQDALKEFAAAHDKEALEDNLEILDKCLKEDSDNQGFYTASEKIIDLLGPALMREARQIYFSSTL